MTERPETFQQWKTRTATAPTSRRFIKVGVILAACLSTAFVTGFWPLWLALPALLVWAIVDWRRTARRRLGVDS